MTDPDWGEKPLKFMCFTMLVPAVVGILMDCDSSTSLPFCCCSKPCKTWVVKVRSKFSCEVFSHRVSQ